MDHTNLYWKCLEALFSKYSLPPWQQILLRRLARRKSHILRELGRLMKRNPTVPRRLSLWKSCEWCKNISHAEIDFSAILTTRNLRHYPPRFTLAIMRKNLPSSKDLLSLISTGDMEAMPSIKKFRDYMIILKDLSSLVINW